MAVRTGEQFLQGLRDGREVWLEGERVADVTAHPKLSRMARTLAGIYDLQHSPELRDRMTFASPQSGEPVALSYLVPESQDDLLRRRGALEIVAASCHGMLGRTPDYVNIQVTATRQLAALYGEREPRYAENVRAYLRAAEADAAPLEGAEGIWPAPEPWIAMRHWYPEAYARVASIVEQLAASGLMLTPTEADLAGPLADDIGKYYQGATVGADVRLPLFRLAWDLIGTQFGSRQTLYERFFNGDVVQLRQRRYASYDYSRAEESVRSFMSKLDGHDAGGGLAAE